MLGVIAERTFSLTFDSVSDFDKAFARQGSDTGYFFRTSKTIAVGQRACIRVLIRSGGNPFFLEGVVAWRRVRPGGPDMPPGVYVNLVDRDRARLDGIVRYLRAGAEGRDRRNHQRYPLFADAAYETADGTHRSEVRNISERGAYLRCMGPLLSVGARFPVTLYLTGERNRGVRMQARVAWIDLFDDTRGMGVSFDSDQTEIKQVSKAIKRIQRDLKNLAR